jgi:hypothetical protein
MESRVFWKKFNEVWLPGIVTGVIFTVLGAYLGWKISYDDTQKQIGGLQSANDQLKSANDKLQKTDGELKVITQGVVAQNAAIVAQANQLGSLLRIATTQGRDLRLALDKQGNVTLAGRALVNSSGNAILTDNIGRPLTTEGGKLLTADSSKVSADSPHRADEAPLLLPNGTAIALPNGQILTISAPLNTTPLNQPAATSVKPQGQNPTP